MLGLALEGGGAKGAFHIGALEAFGKRGLSFGGVTGTSIGALNGAMIAQGDFETLKKLWLSASISKVSDLDDAEFEKMMTGGYDRALIKYLVKKAREIISARGMKIDKVKKLVDTYIDEDRLRASATDYGLVTVSVSDGWKPMELFKEDIPEGMLKDYILASAYYPLFNRPAIGGKRYIDGGMYNNCPVSPLIRKGYNEIYAVRTGSRMPMSKVIDRSVKVTYVCPSESLGSTVDFRKTHVEYNIKLGYYDALRVLDGLGGVRYYIEPVEVAEALAFTERLGDEVYSDIGEILRVKGTKREILTRALAVAREELGLGADTGVAKTLAAVLEEAATAHGVEKFKVYSFGEFVREIKARLSVEPEAKRDTRSYEIALAVLDHIDI